MRTVGDVKCPGAGIYGSVSKVHKEVGLAWLPFVVGNQNLGIFSLGSGSQYQDSAGL